MSFRQKVDFHRYSCYNLTFNREIDPFLIFFVENSCHIIIQSEDSTRTREYWVDPQGNGNSFKAFCNMTTNGGTSVFFLFVFKCWFFSLLFTKQVFFPINRRLDDDVERYFGKLSIFTVDQLALCYIACNSQPACQSLNFRLSDKTCQFNKKTKISCPASLKQNAGFIYADNPNRGKTNQNKFFVSCWKT